MGLQFGWRNLHWVSALPPIVIIGIFKIYISRSYGTPSRYYSPTPAELSAAKTFSERQDGKSNRLSRRFGHPALHAELFTPMLHANMMPLLDQVFAGKLSNTKMKMSEMGGQKMDTTVVQGGIKIAGIAEVGFDALSLKMHDADYIYRVHWSTILHSISAIAARQTGMLVPLLLGTC